MLPTGQDVSLQKEEVCRIRTAQHLYNAGMKQELPMLAAAICQTLTLT